MLKVTKFQESLIYYIFLYHFIAGPPPLETTNPATMTEYKGVSCKARKWSPNTLTGKIATCIKDPKCWAVERSVYCKERRGPHVFTKRVGLVNLVEKEGATVWIKGKHKSQRLLQGGKFFSIWINNSEVAFSNSNFLTDHCADDVKNQDEEGVDCGGVCAKAC